MNKDNERITYEEFVTMFKNAPRIVYTLYDKAEDEIDRLNNIISDFEKELTKYDKAYTDHTECAMNLLKFLNTLKKEGK